MLTLEFFLATMATFYTDSNLFATTELLSCCKLLLRYLSSPSRDYIYWSIFVYTNCVSKWIFVPSYCATYPNYANALHLSNYPLLLLFPNFWLNELLYPATALLILTMLLRYIYLTSTYWLLLLNLLLLRIWKKFQTKRLLEPRF